MIGLLLALGLLAPPQASEARSYDELVALGLSLGREGRLEEAGAAFDRAVALDRRRPEALVERAGVRFLETNYDAAASDLERALALREDAYARDLLASSLHLAGRGDDALAAWNVLGQPVLQSLEITGLAHTRDHVARREISLAEGSVLDLGVLRESRLRLREVGVFDRVTLRPVPTGSGKADLEVALLERHGLFATPAEFIATSIVNAFGHKVSLRYSNLAGAGLSFGGQYRWQESRPEVSVFFDWPRPLGLPAYLHVQAFRGRQVYDFEEPLTRRSRGIDLGLRRVLGAKTVGQIGLRTRDRTFSRPDPAAPPGLFIGLEAGLERRVVDGYRHRVDASLRVFRTVTALGSDLDYTRSVLTLGYRGLLSKPDGTAIEPSAVAAQMRWGKGSTDLPLDESFAPGGSAEMELPLRAHRQTRRGVLGVTPIGRSLGLADVEWRRRVLDKGRVQLGFVLFVDGARIGNVISVTPSTRSFVDIGGGLRLALPGSAILRLDYGHGLSDGKNALFAGLGQTF